MGIMAEFFVTQEPFLQKVLDLGPSYHDIEHVCFRRFTSQDIQDLHEATTGNKIEEPDTVLEDSDQGPWIYQIAAEILASLIAANSNDINDIAKRIHEAGGRIPVKDAAWLLGELQKLAKSVNDSEGWYMYVWISL